MDNNILYDKQFGFRKGHSTSHAIITLADKVSKSLDKGKIVSGVYLDIRKAFDSISHQILLDKLHKMAFLGIQAKIRKNKERLNHRALGQQLFLIICKN